MVLSSGSTATSIVLIIVVVAVVGLLSWFLVIPAWQHLLGLSDAPRWLVLLVFIVGQVLLGVINIPVTPEIRGSRFAINVLGVLGPIAILIWVFNDFEVALDWHPLLAIGISAVAYIWASKLGEKGIQIPVILIWLLAILDVAFFHYVGGYGLRDVLFWGFASQFVALSITDIVRCVLHADEMVGHFRMISFGGAGASDALWSGPSAVLFVGWVAQWLLWDGLDALTQVPPVTP